MRLEAPRLVCDVLRRAVRWPADVFDRWKLLVQAADRYAQTPQIMHGRPEAESRRSWTFPEACFL